MLKIILFFSLMMNNGNIEIQQIMQTILNAEQFNELLEKSSSYDKDFQLVIITNNLIADDLTLKLVNQSVKIIKEPGDMLNPSVPYLEVNKFIVHNQNKIGLELTFDGWKMKIVQIKENDKWKIRTFKSTKKGKFLLQKNY